jgi:DNA-binding PadR family transcriptional regulator
MNIQTHLPLSETTFFILLSLAQEPRHGYAILKDVETLSDKRIRLSTGTLYGALKRFLEGGWIEKTSEPIGSQNGRQRQTYRLTSKGRRILESETRRLGDLLAAAQQRAVKEET